MSSILKIRDNNGIEYEIPALKVNSINFYRGKKISIMGDSVSTFAGYIPEGNAAWYPKDGQRGENDIINVEQTWWHQVIDNLEMELLVNDSWSGSHVYNDEQTTTNNTSNHGVWGIAQSMANRIPRLKKNGVDPDVIIIYGGSNDIFHRYYNDGTTNKEIPVGTFGSVEKDVFENNNSPFVVDTQTTNYSSFAQAYLTMLTRAMFYYPKAKIIVMTPLVQLKQNYVPFINIIKSECEYLGIPVIDLTISGINQFSWTDNKSTFFHDDGHYTVKGMKRLAEFVTDQLMSL